MPDESIGALWKKEKNGTEYFTGNIKVGETAIKIICFKNKYKEGIEKRPDYKIYLSKLKPSEADDQVPF